MCFNSTTSLVAFIVSVACSIYLYVNGINNSNNCDIFFSAVVFLIGCMQLIEYFLWENQDCNSILNHNFSLLIMVLLTLQGIVSCIVYYRLYPTNRYFNKTFVMFYLFIYFCFFIYMMNYLKNFKLCSTPSSKSCRLKWAPYDVLAKNNMPMLVIHLALYAAAGIIVGIEILNNNLTDVFKYKMRYAVLPVVFSLSILYVVFKEINLSIKLFNNPLFFLEYADVFGSVFCFSAVLLGIISVLHI